MSGPKRGLGSRNPTGRPRKIASQTHDLPQEPVDDTGREPVDEPPPPPGEPPADEPPAGGGSGGRRTTVALVVAVVLLLGIGVAEVVYLTRDDTGTVSSSRPVVVGDATRAEAVHTAAQSTEEILSTSYEDYDEQVEQATAKMTDTFAEEYRTTSDGIRDRFLDQRTKLSVKAVGQSVVQASPEQVQALLFLDQYVEKQENGKPATDFAQYRALVTMVHTDQGWLVSDIETK
jgi:Mce-associated membrane protein